MSEPMKLPELSRIYICPSCHDLYGESWGNNEGTCENDCCKKAKQKLSLLYFEKETQARELAIKKELKRHMATPDNKVIEKTNIILNLIKQLGEKK